MRFDSTAGRHAGPVSSSQRPLPQPGLPHGQPFNSRQDQDHYCGACLVSGAILVGLGGPWFLAAVMMITGLLLSLRRGE